MEQIVMAEMTAAQEATRERMAETAQERDEARAAARFWQEQYEAERKRYQRLLNDRQERREAWMRAMNTKEARLKEKICCWAAGGFGIGMGIWLMVSVLAR